MLGKTRSNSSGKLSTGDHKCVPHLLWQMAFHTPLTIQLCFSGLLFSVLSLHPADEEDTRYDDIGNIGRYPHDQSSQLLIHSRRDTPYTGCIYIRSVQRWGKSQTSS